MGQNIISSIPQAEIFFDINDLTKKGQNIVSSIPLRIFLALIF